MDERLKFALICVIGRMYSSSEIYRNFKIRLTMTTLLAAPKNDFLLQTGISELHSDVIRWLNEIEFYKTEISFLIKLMNRQLLRLNHSEKVNTLLELEKKVKNYRTIKLSKMMLALYDLESHLSKLDEDLFSQDEQKIREEHKKLKSDADEISVSIRKLKLEVFAFIENLIAIELGS